MNKLPYELIYHILLYDKRFILRNGKLMDIGKIELTNYQFLLNKPAIIKENNEYTVHFSNIMFKLIYRFLEENHHHRIVFEKTTGNVCVWSIYNLS